MLKNYFLIAIRNLHRHRSHALINIAGLAAGMAACLLIFHFVAFEYSFDDFHEKREVLYRVYQTSTRGGQEPGTGATIGYGFGPAAIQQVPEIMRQARLHPEYKETVIQLPSNPDLVFKENKIFYVDPSFLQMFSFPLVEGDTARALSEPGSVLLSESTARRYFGDRVALGQLIEYHGWIDGTFRVTGVFRDVPPNSHLQFDILLPISDLLEKSNYASDPDLAWNWYNFLQYVELREGADVTTVSEKLTGVLYQYRGDDFRENNLTVRMSLQPLESIHLENTLQAPATVTGSHRTVYFFTIVGIITLLIALVNYVNLETARSLERTREVGVRKVAGAHRGQLITQFLFESATTNSIAALFAIAIASAVLPLINDMAGTQLSNTWWTNPVFLAAFSAAFLLATLLGGLYPAFVLSSFKPISVLKGKARSATSRFGLRHGLVVLQFTASAVLIIGTLVVYAQIEYMRNSNQAISLEQVLTVEGPRVLTEGTQSRDAVKSLVDLLHQIPGIHQLATSATVPGSGFQYYTSALRLETADPATAIEGTFTWIDSSFASVYDIDFIAGAIPESYTGEPAEDESFPVVASKAAVNALGFDTPDEALEKIVNIGGPLGRIVGVFEDFSWSSAHNEREAAIFGLLQYGPIVSIKVNTATLPQTFAAIEHAYTTLFPGNPFVYAFVDEEFDRQYREDQKFATLFTLFAILSIGIACLGLFGLASFTARLRTKEIGVRKVLGATVTGIATRLSMDFLKLVFLSVVIASPIAYLVMNRWLESFAYRIEIGPAVFILTGAVALLIALLTVSYQSIRAAMADPVKSLRYE